MPHGTVEGHLPEPAPRSIPGSAAGRELSAHRARIVRVLLVSLAWLGVVAYVPSVWLSIAVGAWSIAVADTLVYAAVLAVLLLPRVGYGTRAAVLVGCAFLLGALLVLLLGPIGAGPLWLCAVPILAAILFERRGTFGALALTALALAAAALLSATGVVRWEPAPAGHLGLFAVIAGNLLLLSAGLALAVNALIGGLRRSAERAERLAAELAAERALLEEANRKLRAEMEERAAAEGRLRQTEKLSALGTLAGGIAHNLNNLLTPLLMGVEMLRWENDPEERSEVLDRMEGAAGGAREVVRQVLTFSRALPEAREPLDASHAFEEAVRLLRPTLPENVELRADLDPRAGSVALSTADAHQILVNLGTNAVDAMPHGGLLTVSLGVERGSGPDLDPDLDYVRLLVRDTGTGMDEATRARAVEPFFTTRRDSRRTGLGLAMVHGMVNAAGGALLLESAPGAGTTVRLYLPRTAAPPHPAQ